MSTCPVNPADIISTSVVRSRTGGSNSYVVVNVDSRVRSVTYKVYPTSHGNEPVSASCQSGELYKKFDTEGHSFVFPVEKNTLYFMVLTLEIEEEWNHKHVQVTWLMDPFKRRQVTREDVAPAEASAAKK